MYTPCLVSFMDSPGSLTRFATVLFPLLLGFVAGVIFDSRSSENTKIKVLRGSTSSENQQKIYSKIVENLVSILIQFLMDFGG